jgi:hypothetical protein
MSTHDVDSFSCRRPVTLFFVFGATIRQWKHSQMLVPPRRVSGPDPGRAQ